MTSAAFTYITATLFAASILFDSAAGRTQGSSDGKMNDSFDDRMEMYSKWAQATHGRRLSDAYAPATSNPTVVVQPNSGTTSNPNSVVQPGSSQVVQPGTTSGGAFGGCKVLRYHTGFANTTLYYDKIIKDSPNFGECCKSCSADPQCLAWTRVAGGDPLNFRNCYLKYNVDALDEIPARFLNNHEGHVGDSINYPELRYVDETYPVILESGTIPDLFPADYYGCPYSPGNAGKPCDAPPGCNVNGDGVFVAPPCIE